MIELHDGKFGLACGDAMVRVVDFESGECVQTLAGHAQSVRALAELPDGKLASGSWDQTVRVWDVASGSCLFTLVGATAGVCVLWLCCLTASWRRARMTARCACGMRRR